MPVPANPKLYHIVHVDRLPSIISDVCLWCDAEIGRRNPGGTTIGMTKIKQRRLKELTLRNYPDLYVGGCVPFHFCPRSIMLYLLYRGNHMDLAYHDGQEPIVHLEADLYQTVAWANEQKRRWVFTLSSAGAYYFEDRCNLGHLDAINWDAVQAEQWSGSGIARSVKEGKQAEFLLEHSFPWMLVLRIGVHNRRVYEQVCSALSMAHHKPGVEIRADWYY